MNLVKFLTTSSLALSLALLSACGGGGESGSSNPPPPIDPPILPIPEVKKQTISFLGTNHAISQWGTRTDPAKEALGFAQGYYYPALNLRMVVGSLETNRELVRQQLVTIKASGANAISFPIWYEELKQERKENTAIYALYSDGIDDGVWGVSIDSTGARLPEQQMVNLRWLLEQSIDLGFKKIYIRFCHNNHVQHTFVHQDFTDSVRVRVMIRNLARQVWLEKKGTLPTAEIQFDLGGEELTTAVLAKGRGIPFLKALWDSWITLPGGKEDTVGFSMISARSERLKPLWEEVYGGSGVYPPVVAIDIYPNTDANSYPNLNEALAAVAADLGTARPVLILESFWDDKQNADSMEIFLKSELAKTLKIEGLIQWQVVRNSPTLHFSREGSINDLIAGISPFLASRSLLTHLSP